MEHAAPAVGARITPFVLLMSARVVLLHCSDRSRTRACPLRYGEQQLQNWQRRKSKHEGSGRLRERNEHESESCARCVGSVGSRCARAGGRTASSPRRARSGVRSANERYQFDSCAANGTGPLPVLHGDASRRCAPVPTLSPCPRASGRRADAEHYYTRSDLDAIHASSIRSTHFDVARGSADAHPRAARDTPCENECSRTFRSPVQIGGTCSLPGVLPAHLHDPCLANDPGAGVVYVDVAAQGLRDPLS